MVDFVEPFDRLRAGYGHPILAAFDFLLTTFNRSRMSITTMPTIFGR